MHITFRNSAFFLLILCGASILFLSTTLAQQVTPAPTAAVTPIATQLPLPTAQPPIPIPTQSPSEQEIAILRAQLELMKESRDQVTGMYMSFFGIFVTLLAVFLSLNIWNNNRIAQREKEAIESELKTIMHQSLAHIRTNTEEFMKTSVDQRFDNMNRTIKTNIDSLKTDILISKIFSRNISARINSIQGIYSSTIHDYLDILFLSEEIGDKTSIVYTLGEIESVSKYTFYPDILFSQFESNIGKFEKEYPDVIGRIKKNLQENLSKGYSELKQSRPKDINTRIDDIENLLNTQIDRNLSESIQDWKNSLEQEIASNSRNISSIQFEFCIFNADRYTSIMEDTIKIHYITRALEIAISIGFPYYIDDAINRIMQILQRDHGQISGEGQSRLIKVFQNLPEGYRDQRDHIVSLLQTSSPLAANTSILTPPQDNNTPPASIISAEPRKPETKARRRRNQQKPSEPE